MTPFDSTRLPPPPSNSPAPLVPGSQQLTNVNIRLGGDAVPFPTIRGYSIVRELGRGSMGVVYLARQSGLDRLVALKMILAGAHASMEERFRFRDETQALARLQHPNIVQIYEVGLHEDFPYCTLEYLGGGSLHDRLQGKPLQPRPAAELLAVLARAIHAAHLGGFIHRDLKPGNVLFSGSEQPGAGSEIQMGSTLAAQGNPPAVPKITDFGLAKRLGADNDLTGTGTVLGTPSYMAPEQARGQSRDVGPLADVYGLGAILYECLTGRGPFVAADPIQTLQQVIHTDPVPPGRLVPGVPRDLETICLKCLAKEPTSRYASAAELSDDLHRYLAGQSIRARPVGPVEKAGRWCRRNPLVASLLAALVVAIVVGFAGITQQWREAVQQRIAKEGEADNANRERHAKEEEAAKATLAQQSAETERQKAETERQKADANLAHSRVTQAMLLWERNDVANARQMLELSPAKYRGWEWHFLHRLCNSPLAAGQAHDWVQQVAVSTDGHWVVAVCGSPYGDTSRKVFDLCRYRLPELRHDPKKATGFVGGVRRLIFTPRNQLVTLDGELTARLLDGDKLAVIWEQRLPKDHYGGWMSLVGRWLVRADAKHALHLWDLSTGKPGAVLPGHENLVVSVAFSQGGQVMASADNRGGIFLWDMKTSKELRRWRMSDEGDGIRPRENLVTLSPDGRLLAVNGDTHFLRVFHTQTGALAWGAVFRDLPFQEMVGSPLFSPDGTWLAMNSVNAAPRVWESATGRGGHFLRGHEGEVAIAPAMKFSRDSRWLATVGSDRTVRLWDPFSGQEVRVYRGHTGSVHDLAFTPDGRQLVTGSGGPNPSDKQLLAWDLTGDPRGLRLAVATPHPPESVFQSLLAFRPDGMLLSGYAPFGVMAWDQAGNRREDWRFSISHDPWIEWHGMAASADGNFVVGRTDSGATVTRLHLPSRQTRRLEVGERVRTLALSSDGRRVAVGTSTGQLLVWDAEIDEIVFSHRSGPIFRLAFAADGKRLAMCGNSVAWVDLDSGTVHQVADDRVDGAVVGLAFHPKEPWLAAAVERPGEIRLYDLAATSLLRRWTEPRILGDLAFHPDGSRLAVASREGFVTLYDPGTGQEMLTLQTQTGRQRDLAFPPRLAFSPDGRRLAANDYHTRVWIWEADSAGITPEARAVERRQLAGAAAFDFDIRAATALLVARQPIAARFHLEPLRRRELPSPRAGLDRAQVLALAEDWPGAASDYRRWLEQQPAKTVLTDWPDQLQECALATLLSGDPEGYQRICRQHLRPATELDERTSNYLVGLGVWAADAVPDPKAMVAMARRRLAAHPADDLTQLLLGLALYRAGDDASAQAVLEKALRSAGHNRWVEESTHLALALVHHRQGNAERLRQHRQAAERLHDLSYSKYRTTSPQLTHWLAYRALREEMRQALAGGEGKK